MERDMAWNLCRVLYRLQNVFSCIKSFLYARACYLTGIRVEMNRRLTKTNASEQKSKDGCTHGRRIFLRARTSGTETLDALETFESLRRTFISSFRIHNGRSLGGGGSMICTVQRDNSKYWGKVVAKRQAKIFDGCRTYRTVVCVTWSCAQNAVMV